MTDLVKDVSWVFLISLYSLPQNSYGNSYVVKGLLYVLKLATLSLHAVNIYDMHNVIPFEEKT